MINLQKEADLKILHREHALNKIYKESDWFTMKNLKTHHLMMNLITQKIISNKIPKTIHNPLKLIQMERKGEKRKIKIVKKRSLMMKNN